MRAEIQNKKVDIIDHYGVKHSGVVIDSSGVIVLKLNVGSTVTFTNPKEQIKEIIVKHELPSENKR